MRKNSLKYYSALLLSTLVAFIFPMAMAESTACKALVRIDGNFYFASADGSVLSQLTDDSKYKGPIAISPNGKIIAYAGAASPGHVILIDDTGRLLKDVDVSAQDAITNLDWLSPNLLRVAEHISPTSSRFHFANIPTVPFTPDIQVTAPIDAVGQCAVVQNGKDVACAGDTVLSLNGRDIYSLASPFSMATTLQSIELAMGTNARTSTDPSFRIDALDLQDDSIHLKLTSPDGQWQKRYLKSGEIAPLVYPRDLDASGKLAPLLGVQVNKFTSGTVSLAILRSNTGENSFEAGPAWDPRGKRIAFVVGNESGNHSLVIISREMGAAAQDKGALDGRISLPFTGQAKSVKFTADTHVVVEGGGRKFELNVPAQGKIPSDISYTQSSALPSDINFHIGATSSLVPVEQWSCN